MSPEKAPRTTAARTRSRPLGGKTSDAVAEHVLDLLFEGELRAGDRVDLDVLSESLGVSRAPVREALLALEREGLVEIPYHRGVFVARFDAGTIREGFELYALLNALTSGRVARQRDEEVLASLEKATQRVEGAAAAEEFEESAREFRRLINLAVAGPRLRALLRSFNGIVPVASRLFMDRSLDIERGLVRREFEAIRRGDPDAAAAAATEHIRLLGEYAIETLQRRGVIDADPAPADATDDEAGEEDLQRVLGALERKLGTL